jgi:hypothetical protein
MYQASVPALLRGLDVLSSLLDKAEANAKERNFDVGVLLQSRLAPDMHTLTRQVQMVSDGAKGAGARLAGLEPPSMADTEMTVAELKERIRKTADFLKSIKPEQIDGSEERAITLKVPGRELKFLGQAYLTGFVLPNLYFHITAAYLILRHNGVPVGKIDYLGGLPQ